MVRKRRKRKVKPGDGSALKHYKWWHSVYRSQFEIDHDDHRYTLDVDQFDWDERAFLYRDGHQHAVSVMPASFPVPGARIEAATSTYGMKRAHLVLDADDSQTQLHAVPGSAEAWRARIAVRHPVLSRSISAASIVVLLVALAFWVPQAVEGLTHIPAVADRIGGSWTSPVTLPSWLSIALGVGGVIAALERALQLRNHWLVDADTWWFG